MHPISFTNVDSFVLKGRIATGLITGLWRVMCSFYKAYQIIIHLTTENLKRLDLERKGIPIRLIVLVKSIFIECGYCRRLLCVCVCVRWRASPGQIPPHQEITWENKALSRLCSANICALFPLVLLVLCPRGLRKNRRSAQCLPKACVCTGQSHQETTAAPVSQSRAVQAPRPDMRVSDYYRLL